MNNQHDDMEFAVVAIWAFLGLLQARFSDAQIKNMLSQKKLTQLLRALSEA